MLVFRELESRARPLGIQVHALDGVTMENVDKAFAAIVANRMDALIVATTASLLGQREQIVAGAARVRVPAIYARNEYPEAGGLLSYGTDIEMLWLRAADYVNRILQGASPAELPFEMAATFKLVLNMKTARTLGFNIPQSIRIRADETIE